jgi:hypothetical protein
MFSGDERQKFTTSQEMYPKMKLLTKYLENVVMEIEKRERLFIKKQ